MKWVAVTTRKKPDVIAGILPIPCLVVGVVIMTSAAFFVGCPITADAKLAGFDVVVVSCAHHYYLTCAL